MAYRNDESVKWPVTITTSIQTSKRPNLGSCGEFPYADLSHQESLGSLS